MKTHNSKSLLIQHWYAVSTSHRASGTLCGCCRTLSQVGLEPISLGCGELEEVHCALFGKAALLPSQCVGNLTIHGVQWVAAKAAHKVTSSDASAGV